MISRRAIPALPALCALRPAQAQTSWPAARPIEILVGFTAGGGLDVLARAVAPFLASRLPSARFVIVNRPGAGGQLAHEAAATAAPDGYTLGGTTMPNLISHLIERPVRYDPGNLTWLANLVDDPCGLFTRPESPWRSLTDVVAAARARPETLTYGLTGVGSDDHLTMFRMEAATGTRLVHVPFPGIGQMLPQVFSGQVDLAAMNVSEALPFLREGRLRGLGQAAPARWESMPDLATYREQGIDVLGSATRGFVAPGGLPSGIAARLLTAFAEVVADPVFLAEAQRLALPLRPVLGEAFREEAMALERELRAIWARRRWNDG